MIRARLKLLEAEHNLRLRSHRHTSYPALALLLMVVTVLVTGVSATSQAAVQNPQSGSVGLTGTVPGPAPTQAAQITSPHSGDHTTSTPITVTGTCPANTFVFVNKNNVLAGEAACTNDRFSLQLDLFAGSNQLVAQVVDALGQYGPDSTPVTVFYDAPSTTTANGVTGNQLFIETDATVVAGQPGSAITRTITLVGGIGPYAVAWDYGDGTTSVMSVNNAGPLSVTHSYTEPGTYRVIARVSDSASNQAVMQMITVVNGPVAGVSGTNKGSTLPGDLLAVWPLLFFAIILVLTFWLGERRMQRTLARRELLSPSA